jgi:hypothetical protein
MVNNRKGGGGLKKLKVGAIFTLVIVLFLSMTGIAEAKSKSYFSSRSYSKSYSKKSYSTKTYYVNPKHGPVYKVKGYTTKTGKKVAPYKRTKANSTKKDNLRYRG